MKMKCIHCMMKLFLVFEIIHSFEDISIKRFRNIKLYDGYLPTEDDDLIWVKFNISNVRCAGSCLDDVMCLSYFYCKTTEKCCYGYSRQVTEFSNLTSQPGIKYYEQLMTSEAITEPSDYTYASEFGFYYSIKTIPRLFLDAALVCQLEGGSLFMSDTEAKNNFIVNAIGNNDTETFYWIGFYDLYFLEGDWRWIDGRPSAGLYWGFAPGQPDNYDESFIDVRRMHGHCAALNSATGMWIDEYCGQYYCYICQRP